jgi:CheY-like chemotaxis protein
MLCDDLVFGSKVTATGSAHGVRVAVARTPAGAIAKLGGAGCLIVDLHLPGLDVAALMTQVRAAGGVTVIAFGSHVDVETLKAARKAGCDQVLPRSQFVVELETKLAEWGRGEPAGGCPEGDRDPGGSRRRFTRWSRPPQS